MSKDDFAEGQVFPPDTATRGLNFVVEGEDLPVNLGELDEGGLMDPEETRAVRVTLEGGDPYVKIELLSMTDMQHNPTAVTGSKEFGVETIPAVPWTPLTQNTVKYGIWDPLGFVVDTYKKSIGEKFLNLNAGPYLLTISLMEIQVYLKKLSFVQHPGREWYYTWTLEFKEMRPDPFVKGIVTTAPVAVELPSIDPSASFDPAYGESA
jgi:hypothetical protein